MEVPSHKLVFKSGEKTWEVFFAGPHAHLHWSDLYNSCDELLDGEEPEQDQEGNVWIGIVDISRPLDWPEIMQELYTAGLCAEPVLQIMQGMDKSSTIVIGP